MCTLMGGSKAHHFHTPLSSLGSLDFTQKLGKPPSSTISLANTVNMRYSL